MPAEQMTRVRGLVDEDAAREAVELALPSIEKAFQREGVSGERVLHIVVMDPAVQPGEAAFEDAILYERSVGDPRKWQADYRSFARAKAALAWRAGCDTHLIQELRPHLLRPGETLLWGSAWRDGLVVGASGAHPWFDEAFANAVAGFLLAIAQERARGARRPADAVTRRDADLKVRATAGLKPRPTGAAGGARTTEPGGDVCPSAAVARGLAQATGTRLGHLHLRTSR